MKKNIVFFEVKGGSDKGEDGYRKDTMPMVNALKAKGWNAEVIFFEVSKKDEIYKYVKKILMVMFLASILAILKKKMSILIC